MLLGIGGLFICSQSYGQILTGYSSIGLGTTNPRALLDVGSDISNGKLGSVFGRLVEGDAISEGTFLGVRGFSSSLVPGTYAIKSFALEHSFYGVTNSSINFFRGGASEDGFLAFNTGKNVERFRIDNKGNIGLGTTSPRAIFDIGADISNGKLGPVFGRMVEGDGTLEGTFLGVRGYSTSLVPGTYAVKSFALEHSFYGVTNSSINFFRGGGSEDGFIAFNTGKNVERMRLENNGNVSIVTPNAKFLVNGNILATSIKVQNQVWPDYVFEPSYEKLTLPELEKFIQTNKHLPEIPSAKTVAKDGIDLSDMNAKLLKKIEELTLYTIDQDKRLNRKDKDFSELKEKMDGLEAKLEKLISAQKN